MGSRSTPPAASSQPARTVTVKKESPEDDIKEYAETAMNELLGWYGYDKVDSRYTQGLNLHHFAAARRSPSDLDSSDDPECCSPGRRGTGTGSSQGSPPPDPLAVPADCSVCGWCQKVSSNKQLFTLKTPAGQKAFCSEVCFTQCRRANFKRNKTCDWCRHIRHTVNYVDFQDGEHQLQFCSDKCLNQYKMNIFCKETQAHLQMHPHLQEGPGATGGTLITPDLWLRDCRSESPLSDRSLSPPPALPLPLPPPPPPAASSPEPPPTTTPPTTTTARCRRPTRSRRQLPSPRSIDTVSPPKPPPPPPPPFIAHRPPPHLLPPPHLIPPPHIFPRLPQPPFSPIPRPPRTSPTHHTSQRPPPLLPLPRARGPAVPVQPPPPPPTAPAGLSRFLLPPVTVMVPYPIIVPIPIPIPIPIPFPLPKLEEEVSKQATTPETPVISSPAPIVVPPQVEPKGEPKAESKAESKAELKVEPKAEPKAEEPQAEPQQLQQPRQGGHQSNRPPRKRRRLDVAKKDESVLERKFVPA